MKTLTLSAVLLLTISGFGQQIQHMRGPVYEPASDNWVDQYRFNNVGPGGQGFVWATVVRPGDGGEPWTRSQFVNNTSNQYAVQPQINSAAKSDQLYSAVSGNSYSQDTCFNCDPGNPDDQADLIGWAQDDYSFHPPGYLGPHDPTGPNPLQFGEPGEAGKH